MAEVKFVNAAKYKGVRYPAHTPFQVADEDVDSLVKSGAIVLVAPQAKAAEGEGDEDKSLDEMTVNELKAYAAEKEIDISKVEKKADILAAIKAAEGEGDENE
jgi:hypothetical protein